ncbi:hypothetical protein HK100_000499 [Physocladia obscura]|uniref:Fcf2 pre-rRNA processing C-terminal domain-containing protein n=1 Tax=Physocladia obscura TaxID=109957 RepID=A0AAD5XHJ3_9FUNG|nr:hypothetical protein HK100_000499 [Physocladia obscura]
MAKFKNTKKQSNTQLAVAVEKKQQTSREEESALSFFNSTDVGSYDDVDLDALLTKSIAVLTERKAQEQLEKEQHNTEEYSLLVGVIGNGNDKKRKTESLLSKIQLDSHLNWSEEDAYFVESSANGAIRLNPKKIEIVKSKDANELKKKSSKSLLDKIVVTKAAKEVAPELDYDDKTKKKMVVETAGAKWFDMPAPELTDSLKREIQIINARNVLDPKHHYKRADKNAPEYPKFFQMGTIVAGAADFYGGRVSKRDRKDGFVDEVLNDSKTKAYLKRKWGEIQEQKSTFARHATTKKKGKVSLSGSFKGGKIRKRR